MKKYVTAMLIALMIMPLSVIGASARESKRFNDESTFAGWYAKAVATMSHNNIISGYADGSFQGDRSVTRAEVAVMLERFAKALGQELRSEPRVCTMEYRYGLGLFVYDQYGEAVADATISFEQMGGDEKDVFNEGEDGVYSGIGEGNGYYKVLIEKEGYVPFTRSYKLDHDGCHVTPMFDTIILIKKA